MPTCSLVRRSRSASDLSALRLRVTRRRTAVALAEAVRQTLAVAVACSCLLLTAPSLAQQPDRERTEALARRAGERLQSLQREADRLAAQERTLLGDLRKLELDRQIKAEQLRQARADADEVQAELDATTTRIEQLDRQDLSERPELRARLVETYKLGRGRYLRLLLATSDLRRLGQATRAVAVLAKLDRERIVSHKQTLADLKASRAT
ncbi:MAG: hypothetical protein HY655_09285, partial [Acidobacteria bacterium]|nr:hypothetical protein [Acidobacteriota bacterium]